jgi:metal-responsive CopG/Arc/MetJ family transcriptional regulator
MKLKTSVTLSEDVMKTIDRLARKGESRSAIVERLVRESLAARAKQAAADRDRARLDDHAAALNAEVEDVLRYQSDS